MKISSVIILFAVLVLMVGCQSSSYFDASSTSTFPSPSSSQSESGLYNSSILEYADIVSDYRAWVAYRLSDNFVAQWYDGKYISESQSLMNSRADIDGDRTTHEVELETKWFYMITDMLAGLENPSIADFGYFLEDINGDSIPELFWVRNDKTILAIFTICDDNVVLLDAFFARYPCVVTPQWGIYTLAGGGTLNQWDIRLLSTEGRLETICSFGTEYSAVEMGTQYFEIKDGQKILVDEADYQELLESNPFEFGPEWNDLQLTWLE